jgi:citrate lyase gamma subunit
MLKDVRLSLHNAISGEAILKSYTDETRQQFAAVIKEIIQDTLLKALTLSQQRMDESIKGTLDNSIRDAQKSLAAVTTDFRDKLGSAWGQLLCYPFGATEVAPFQDAYVFSTSLEAGQV